MHQLEETSLDSGQTEAWREADRQLDDMRQRLDVLEQSRSQSGVLTTQVGAMAESIVVIRQRLDALESRPLGACGGWSWILGNPPYTGGNEPPAPDTIAVPVETLRAWHASLLKADDVLSDERATTATALAYLSGWAARELSMVRCAMWALLPHEED